MILRKMRLRQKKKKKKKWFPYEKNVYKSPDEKNSIFNNASEAPRVFHSFNKGADADLR